MLPLWLEKEEDADTAEITEMIKGFAGMKAGGTSFLVVKEGGLYMESNIPWRATFAMIPVWMKMIGIETEDQ